jgi:serine protease
LEHRVSFERLGAHQQASKPPPSRTLIYGGGVDGIGVTSGQPQVYLVFWGSQWGTASTAPDGSLALSNDPQAGVPALQQFFRGLGTNHEHWSTVMTQYCDGPLVAQGATSCPSGAPHVGYPSGGVLAGVWYDNAAPQPLSPGFSALADEAVSAATHFGNTTPASNRYAQYVVLSATGQNPDHWFHSKWCAWHSYTPSVHGDVAFTNLPYLMDAGAACGANFVNAGTAGMRDGYTIVGGHEYSETITDQNPSGGWVAASGAENADECAWIRPGNQGGAANLSLKTGSFPVQGTWSNATNRCELEARL